MTLKTVGHMVRAIVRMKMGAKEWAKKMELKRSLQQKIDKYKEQRKYDEALAAVQNKFAGFLEQSPSKSRDVSPSKTKNASSTKTMALSPVKARSISTPVKQTSRQVTVEDDTQTSFSRVVSARKSQQATIEDADDTQSSFSRVLSVRRQVTIEDETQSTFSRVMAARKRSKNGGFNSSPARSGMDFSLTEPMSRNE